MARHVKKYVAGAIPTPKEVADLNGKIVKLEETTGETSNKVTKLQESDVAITQSLADEVAKEALVNKVIKEALAREDAAIGGMIKDVETLKDRAQNAESSITAAKVNIENLGRSVNSAGTRANMAFDKASQNENSITGINQTLQTVADEQQQQNVRIDDLEADAKETGGNFELLKSTGVLADKSLIMSIDHLTVYNNEYNGNVTMERRLPNDKVSVPHVVVTGTGVASPAHGGIYHGFTPKPHTAYWVEMRALIPLGRSLNMQATNDIDAFHFTNLTPMVGTGKIEQYKVEIHAGPLPKSNTGFYFIEGGDLPTAESPLEWIVTEAQVYELPAGWE